MDNTLVNWKQYRTEPRRISGLKLKITPAQRKIPENSRCLSSLIITVFAVPGRFIRPAFPM